MNYLQRPLYVPCPISGVAKKVKVGYDKGPISRNTTPTPGLNLNRNLRDRFCTITSSTPSTMNCLAKV